MSVKYSVLLLSEPSLMYALAKTKLVSVKLVQTCLNLFEKLFKFSLDLSKNLLFYLVTATKKTFGKIGRGIVPGRATPFIFSHFV